MDRFKSTIRKGGVKDGRNPGGVSFKHMGREGLIVLALSRAVPGHAGACRQEPPRPGAQPEVRFVDQQRKKTSSGETGRMSKRTRAYDARKERRARRARAAFMRTHATCHLRHPHPPPRPPSVTCHLATAAPDST